MWLDLTILSNLSNSVVLCVQKPSQQRFWAVGALGTLEAGGLALLCSLTLAAVSSRQECRRTRAQPIQDYLFPLHSGQFWATAPAPTGRNWCSQTGEKHVVNPCTHPSWSKEEGEGCASGVCLCGCRVRRLFISASVWVPVVSRSPQKGHKLTFSSGNAPFREEQLCHHSNTCEPPVLFLVVSCVLCE